jgi:hypothetical protein
MMVSGESSAFALFQKRMLELPTSKIALLGGGEEKSRSSNVRICDSYRMGSGWVCPTSDWLSVARNSKAAIFNIGGHVLARKKRGSSNII